MQKHIIFILFLLSSRSLLAQEQWIELINGKDLSGWKASENSSTWTATDGMLQAVGKRSHLWYVGPHLGAGFKNFELEVQVKTFKLANSGIYFHAHYQETGWPESGFEIQVNNSHIGEGDYIELKRMASLYGTRNVYKTFAKDNQWNLVKARVVGNHVQVWLNGMKTVDYIQPEKDTKGIKRLSQGTFALQGHDVHSKMQYKSIKVRRLPDGATDPLIAKPQGSWYDSLVAYQAKQIAFIDILPNKTLTAQQLAEAVYNTGINAALVKSTRTAGQLQQAKNKPLFTGLVIHNLATETLANTDYVIGQSNSLYNAKQLLGSGQIHAWADSGHTLNTNTAQELLGLANRYSVAIVIDNQTQHPSIEILKIAKQKGLKFAFSGLLPAESLAANQYVFKAISQAGISYQDLFIPQW
jgi:hypothetical protein